MQRAYHTGAFEQLARVAERRSVRVSAEVAATAARRKWGPEMNIERVPVIDLVRGDSARTRAAIDAACRDWGFFQVVGHGIDATLFDAVLGQMRAFFAQPRDAKHAVSRSEGN